MIFFINFSENLRKELENLNKNLLELDNKEKLQKEIIDNSDEIERIKRRMKEIDVEKEDVISNIDFLNKVFNKEKLPFIFSFLIKEIEIL